MGNVYFCSMNFTSQIRHNLETGEDEKYYRLKESYRDASGRPCTRILLNVGCIHGLSSLEIRDIARGLTYKYENQDHRELWDDNLCCYSDVVRQKIDEYWRMLEEEDKLDLIHNTIEASKALTDYKVKPGAKTVTVYDCKKRPIELQEVEVEGGDYYLKVKSPSKALKEQSMNRSFRKRFEEGMKAVAASIGKKNGTKKYEAVLKRIAKLEGKYPSISRYYSIKVVKDEKDKVTSVTWLSNCPMKRCSARTSSGRTSGRSTRKPHGTTTISSARLNAPTGS